jgi:uncharacterized coiled-coil protein SlyX
LESRIEYLEQRFAGILNLDEEAARLTARVSAQNKAIDKLASAYLDKKAVFDRLVREIAIFDERLAFAEMGVYEPHFDFSDSEDYKSAIIQIREQQKNLIAAGNAVVCTTNWTLDGSASKGQTMTKRNIRLTLRALITSAMQQSPTRDGITSTLWRNGLLALRRKSTSLMRLIRLSSPMIF